MVTREIQLATTRLSLYDRGAGRPLLFVHGFPLDHTMWSGQLTEFAAEYRVLAPDLSGFGASAPIGISEYSMRRFADELAELLDRLEVTEPVVLCGLSMGGYIAWQFWQQHRPRLRALVLCDTRAAADADDVARGRLYMAARVLSEGPASIAEGMLTKLFAPQTLERNGPELKQARQVMLNTRPETIAAVQRGMAARPDMSAHLSQIDVPTLLIVGEQDVITPADEMQRMAEQIPEAEMRRIAHAGHMAPLEQPRAANEIIRRFLSRK